MQDPSDSDFSGMWDQLAVALLSTHGSTALHDAALAAINALCTACGVSAAQVLPERWTQPWIDMKGLSLYTVPLVVLVRSLRRRCCDAVCVAELPTLCMQMTCAHSAAPRALQRSTCAAAVAYSLKALLHPLRPQHNAHTGSCKHCKLAEVGHAEADPDPLRRRGGARLGGPPPRVAALARRGATLPARAARGAGAAALR